MLHKLSSQLIRENDVICIEDLAPKNMGKNHSSPSPYRTRAGASSADSLNIKQSGMAKKVVVIDRFFSFFAALL